MKPKNFVWTFTFIIVTVLVVLGILFPTNLTAPEHPELLNAGDMAWMLIATALVLLMTPGLSFFYGGMVSTKSVISTMLQSFISLGVVSLVWVLCGFSLAFGDSMGGVLGNPMTFWGLHGVGLDANPTFSATIPFLLYALFQLKFAIITPALITGSFAERVRFDAYLIFIILFTVFIYCPLAHWTWHPDGFLHKWGVLDFAGGTVVHMSAGIAALAGAIFLGPRKEQFSRHLPANIPYIILGTGLLWFGWFGFNAGSALGANTLAVQAFATTNFASAAAMVTWVIFDAMRGRKISAMGAAIGAVVGLVAVTPAAGFINVGQSIFIGFAASIVSNIAVYYKEHVTVDDTLDVFPCHGLGGIVGMILTAVFAKDVGLFYGQTATFLAHMGALLIIFAYVFIGSYSLFWLINKFVPLRVTVEQEVSGLDTSQHGETHDIKERYGLVETHN
jgi:ammonium transporter, Amt family